MKVSSNVRMALALGVIGALGLGRGNAQTFLQGSVQPSTNSIQLGGSVTYTIGLTNFSQNSLQLVMVTNTFSSPVTNVAYSFTRALGGGSNLLVSSTSDVFTLNTLISGDSAQMTLTVSPTVSGTLTNTVVAASPASGIPPVTLTNVTVSVTVPTGDVAVSITGPSQTVYVNDPLSYTITVTNTGPSSASDVMVTNGISTAKLLSATSGYTLAGNLLVFDLGALAGGSSQSVGVTVQPTAVGILPVTAAISVTGAVDTDTSDNSVLANLPVSGFLPGQIVVSNLSAMVFDPQTSLMKQTIRAWNVGTNSAPSLRVGVTNLPVRLFNAVGTNNGNPYVLYAAPLATNSHVDLGMEYYNPTRLAITIPNSSYIAQIVALADLSATNGTGSTFAITKQVTLTNGTFLIEFQSTNGASYTVLYSADPNFSSNVFAAQPSIAAQANRTQWIDDGPPKTISAPTNAPVRFYRVRQN